jgi:hypothetical protein
MSGEPSAVKKFGPKIALAFVLVLIVGVILGKIVCGLASQSSYENYRPYFGYVARPWYNWAALPPYQNDSYSYKRYNAMPWRRRWWRRRYIAPTYYRLSPLYW